MEKGRLYGVSVGPGDPELLTLRALRAIREADCIAAPVMGDGHHAALDVVAEHVEGKRVIECPVPMARDRAAAQDAYERIADTLAAELDTGRDVAFLTLGDAGVYSTYYYVHKLLVERGYEADVIPGVTSFSAAAARLGRPLCEGSENLLVVPVAREDVSDALDFPANKVLMKSGRSIQALKEQLAARGLLDGAALVVDCGMPGERVYERLADADVGSVASTGYFSTVLVRDPR